MLRAVTALDPEALAAAWPPLEAAAGVPAINAAKSAVTPDVREGPVAGVQAGDLLPGVLSAASQAGADRAATERALGDVVGIFGDRAVAARALTLWWTRGVCAPLVHLVRDLLWMYLRELAPALTVRSAVLDDGTDARWTPVWDLLEMLNAGIVGLEHVASTIDSVFEAHGGEQTVVAVLRSQVHAILFSSPDVRFLLHSLIHSFCSQDLAMFSHVRDEDSDESLDDEDEHISEDMPVLVSQNLRRFASILKGLRILSRSKASRESQSLVVITVEDAISEVCEHVVAQQVRKWCSGVFDERQLERALNWANTRVRPWLHTVWSGHDITIHEQQSILHDADESEHELSQQKRLEYTLIEEVGRVRVNEIFEILVEYPESIPALEDLRDALARTSTFDTAAGGQAASGLRNELIHVLRRSLDSRLLHRGAQTTDLVDTFVSLIKSIRFISKGTSAVDEALLDSVSEPVRNYLRKRPDTIRCVVHACTAEPDSELYRELASGAQHGHGTAVDVETDWIPKLSPQHNGTPSTELRGSGWDVLSELVSIYGSPALFINEYRTMLAEKLLSFPGNAAFRAPEAVVQTSVGPIETAPDWDAYDVDADIRVVELLKLRFGETSLRLCEIMLRDIAESKRINKECAEAASREMQISSTLLSYRFWPTDTHLGMESTRSFIVDTKPGPHVPFVPPENIQTVMRDYEHRFQVLKAARKLSWFSDLGSVVLDVELDGGDVLTNVACTPLQASVLHALVDADSSGCSVHDVENVARSLQADLTAEEEVFSDLVRSVRKAFAFWAQKNVLRRGEGPGEFLFCKTFAEAEDHQGKGRNDMADDFVNGEGTNAGELPEVPKHWKEVENYVTNMLTTFGTLAAASLHSKLSMFLDTYSMEQTELEALLDDMCTREMIEHSGNGGFTKSKK